MIERAQLQTWSDRLRAITERGAGWDGDEPYDSWRFERIAQIAAELGSFKDDDPGLVSRPYGHMLLATANEGHYWARGDADKIALYTAVRRVGAELLAAQGVDVGRFSQLIETPSPQSPPLTGCEAAMFDAGGRLLLIQRSDNGLWALPGGAMEVGETPSATACREGREETGIHSEAQALLGVYDIVGSRSRLHILIFVFVCRPLDAAAQPVVTNETLDVGWFVEDALPPLSSRHAERIIADAFSFQRGELTQTVWE